MKTKNLLDLVFVRLVKSSLQLFWWGIDEYIYWDSECLQDSE